MSKQTLPALDSETQDRLDFDTRLVIASVASNFAEFGTTHGLEIGMFGYAECPAALAENLARCLDPLIDTLAAWHFQEFPAVSPRLFPHRIFHQLERKIWPAHCAPFNPSDLFYDKGVAIGAVIGRVRQAVDALAGTP